MNQAELKKRCAEAAIDYVIEDEYLGVGTGTTVGFFITALAMSGKRVKGCVSSSEATTRQLLTLGFPVCDLNDVGHLSVYVDGCDEINDRFHMIKGGGGALTREKICADASDKYICIADESKLVKTLGKFPLPIEVLPMAITNVSNALKRLGGDPKVRDFVTDNGNRIIDVYGLVIEDPVALESQINQIPGVVTCGIFGARGADVLLLATGDGVRVLEPADKDILSKMKQKL
ncbi:MAG: ribose-5-phosphate isomerase RpiA [Burkholderiaceae bacterium]|nr:ribose-5-phosphate isomerase RpiA [Burkholderiaceae bacterium]